MVIQVYNYNTIIIDKVSAYLNQKKEKFNLDDIVIDSIDGMEYGLEYHGYVNIKDMTKYVFYGTYDPETSIATVEIFKSVITYEWKAEL